MALSTSPREAGSRLLVGSSSRSTLAADTTSIANASRVFSPPESTPAGFCTSSPVNRNEPRTLRTSVSLRFGEAVFMLSSTLRFTSRVSCSCA